jgi:FkbM family methyltransferase
MDGPGPVNALRRTLSFLRREGSDVYRSYVSRGRASRATPYGFRMVGGGSQHHLSMQRGDFEPEETALFQEIFADTDVFVDVGANIGFYSCMARHRGCHVLAVEPLDRNLALLFQNLEDNGWTDVEVLPVGLAGRPGTATLFGASSTGASLIGNWAGASRAFRRTIALSTLDILVGNRFPGKRVFAKVDVEGAEFAVLEGALACLPRDPRPTWVVEICLSEYHPGGQNPRFLDTFELFWRFGYEAWTADADRRAVSRDDVLAWISAGKTGSGTINYLFRPAGASWKAAEA